MIIVVLFIVLLILAKCYKLCVRENVINVYLITDEYYVRYREKILEKIWIII